MKSIGMVDFVLLVFLGWLVYGTAVFTEETSSTVTHTHTLWWHDATLLCILILYCTNIHSITFIQLYIHLSSFAEVPLLSAGQLKVLSSEMDPAKIRLIR